MKIKKVKKVLKEIKELIPLWVFISSIILMIIPATRNLGETIMGIFIVYVVFWIMKMILSVLSHDICEVE